MKAQANTQYNDFRGTSAADISDDTNLNEFIESVGLSTDRYLAIGASFFCGYSSFFSAKIICLDKESGHNVSIHVDLDKDQFFDLFKRLDVFFIERGYSVGEIHEEISISDLLEE